MGPARSSTTPVATVIAPSARAWRRNAGSEERCAELLPVPYFHVVFTLPEELNPLAVSHPRLLYSLLFRCASETLLEIAADPKHLGARIGVLAVLHTWGQKLTLHPHLHCIVPGGGLSIDGDWWIGSRPDFFLPVRVLRKLFRGKVLATIKAAAESGELPSSHLPDFDVLYRKAWVVYCKPPFGSPEQVLAYLARYTHRVAISNRRLIRLEDLEATFYLERLWARAASPGDDAVGRGVSPPVSPPRSAGPFRPDPLLRPAG